MTEKLFVCPIASNCKADLCTHREPHPRQYIISPTTGLKIEVCIAAFKVCPCCEEKPIETHTNKTRQ